MLVPPLAERSKWTGSTLSQYKAKQSLAHVWSTLKTSIYFEFKEFIPSISLSGNHFGLKLGIAEVVFVSMSSESYLLVCSAFDVSSFGFWLCGSWLLIMISLLLE